jgi:hypothetical protein
LLSLPQGLRKPLIVLAHTSTCTRLGLHGDESILDCFRYFREQQNEFTVLLSNDKNLCSKVLIHYVKTISIGSDLSAARIDDLEENDTAGREEEKDDADDDVAVLEAPADEALELYAGSTCVTYGYFNT